MGPTRAALIGVGQFGRTLLSQSQCIRELDLLVLCDIDIEGTVAACRSLGIDADMVRVAETLTEAAVAIETGKLIVCPDPEIAVKLPVDVVIEATGNALAGAHNCLAAINAGRHVVLVSKETDSVIGPLIAATARRAGLVLSQVDGDQPSLLLGLISWAKSLGMEVACGGKASEFDFVVDWRTKTLSLEGWNERLPFPDDLWDFAPGKAVEVISGRAVEFAQFPQRTPADFCEMCLVANGSGLKPDTPEMHAAIARPTELPNLYRDRECGGLLNGKNRLDIFNCLRRSDEISFAGGVFAVLKIADKKSGELFASKGIPVSDDRKNVLVYNPTHLLGAEAAMSVLAAHRMGESTGSSDIRPVCDVAMRASENVEPGIELTDLGLHHRVEGIEPMLLDYTPLVDDAPLPYFLGLGAKLKQSVDAGAIVRCSDVVPPEDPYLWDLRREQDRMFHQS